MSVYTEIQAQELQERLQIFGIPSQEGRRESQIPDLLDSFPGAVDIDVLNHLKNPQEQARLMRAIDLTLQTPFLLEDGNIINPWAGGFTVVALDRDGRVEAAHTNP